MKYSRHHFLRFFKDLRDVVDILGHRSVPRGKGRVVVPFSSIAPALQYHPPLEARPAFDNSTVCKPLPHT